MNYVFNIRGWLTNIMSGVFTQKMFYNQTENQLGNTPMYNGNISAIRWSDQMMVAANPTRAYRYDYDAMGRLKAANHFEGSMATNKFSSMYTYDLNGNIGTLKRYGDAANLIDDMLYDYTNSGNKLMSVTDAASDTTTFHDRNTDGVDYGYDANGNMILDKNKKIDTIYYNHLNIPTIVVMEPVAGKRDSLVYYHDAAGIKLRQDIYVNDSLKVKQEYAGDFYYENDTLKFINHEEGRVVVDMEASVFDYQVNILDHLGNTRVTLSTTPKVYSFTATMEDASASNEEGIFQNIAETRVSMAAANQTEGGIKAARIPNTDPIGPLTMLQVNKGDTVKLDAWAYYEGDGSTDGLISESALLAALVAGYSGATGIAEVSAQTEAAIEGGLDFPNNLIPKTNETNDDAPKAFINYMQFDEQMTFITSGFVQISTAAQFSKEHVVLPPITIDRNGFVMAYVSNESNQLNWVHFDDFAVTHSKTPIVQVDDYYPFGGAFNSFTRSYSEPQKYKYQGKEEQVEIGTLDFNARMYDPTIGRTFQQDPMADRFATLSPYSWVANNPISMVDPSGMVIEEGSQKEWDKNKRAVEGRRNSLQGKVDKLNAKAEAKGWSADKLASKTGNLNERISSLDNSLGNMDLLENSSQVYALSTPESGKPGSVSMRSDGVVDISFSGTANFVHETTHAGQFESNEMGFSADGGTLAQDVTDETSAYKAQFAYDPSSVSGISSSSVANSFSGITASWVLGINGGTTYGPNGANTGHSEVNMNSSRDALLRAYPNSRAYILSKPKDYKTSHEQGSIWKKYEFIHPYGPIH